MRYSKIILPLLLMLSLGTLSRAQSLEQMNTRLLSEKVSFSELRSKYIDPKLEYDSTRYGKDLLEVRVRDNRSELKGEWFYLLRNDSLDQIHFIATQILIDEKWYRIFMRRTDSAINYFTNRYGAPATTTPHRSDFAHIKHKIGCTIRKVKWNIGGQHLHVVFSLESEKDTKAYRLQISRYTNYFFNIKMSD